MPASRPPRPPRGISVSLPSWRRLRLSAWAALAMPVPCPAARARGGLASGGGAGCVWDRERVGETDGGTWQQATRWGGRRGPRRRATPRRRGADPGGTAAFSWASGQTTEWGLSRGKFWFCFRPGRAFRLQAARALSRVPAEVPGARAGEASASAPGPQPQALAPHVVKTRLLFSHGDALGTDRHLWCTDL